MIGTLDDMIEQIGLPNIIKIQYSDRPNVGLIIEKIENGIVHDNCVSIYYDKSKISSPSIITEISKWGEPIDIQMSEPDIEEIIQRIF